MKFRKEPIYYRVTWVDNYGDQKSDIVVANSIAEAIHRVKADESHYVKKYIQKVEQLQVYNGGV